MIRVLYLNKHMIYYALIYLVVGLILGFRREVKKIEKLDSFNLLGMIVYALWWPIHILMVFGAVLIALFV